LLFSITGGNTDNAFQITGDSITVLNPSAINYDTVANRTFNLTTQINDGVDSVYTNYTININDVSIFFDDQTFTVEEKLPSGTVVRQITSDYDGEGTLTYSITAGNTDNAFSIVGDNILVQNANALNYDIVANRTFNLTIEATDGTSTETATYTINLEDITLRIHDRTYVMYHQSAVGTIVGEVASEYYGTDTLELSILSGNTADAFEIIDSNIVVKTANALDYSIEANRTFNLTLEAREDDTDTITETANYTINVSLSLINLQDQTYAIKEESANGTVVGQIVSNYFGSGTVSYSITQGNTNNAFQLDGTNIVVQNSEALDYDIVANRTFNLTIEATDGIETTSAVYTINITPLLINLEARTYSIDEGSATGTVVGLIVANYTGTGAVSYSITQGNTDNAFQINGTNIVVQNSEALDYDIVDNRTFNLTIEATDGTETTSAVYTININEAVTAINQTKQQRLLVYPNPAQNVLNIEIDNNLGNKVLLKLINNSGTIVHKQIAFANTTVQINTSDLEAGIYFVEIITDNKKIAEKVIIE
ncbi:MAG: cadherin domain-containing protein, partial [Bacteroidales bacterium]|nr:cadherin domain-containing protein [Bacteroidales bacterium]